MAEKKKTTARKTTAAAKKKTTKKTASKTAAAKKTTKAAATKTAKATKPSKSQQFMDFVREQGVIGLAIAVVLGIAAKTAVDGLVNGLINPFVGMFLDSDSLAEATFVVSDTALTNGPTEFQYGLFLSGLLNLLVVAAVVYFVVKSIKFDKKKD